MHIRVRILSSEYILDTEQKRCMFLSSHFRGPALDWMSVFLQDTRAMTDYDAFVEAGLR